jgi:hypothetical protein
VGAAQRQLGQGEQAPGHELRSRGVLGPLPFFDQRITGCRLPVIRRVLSGRGTFERFDPPGGSNRELDDGNYSSVKGVNSSGMSSLEQHQMKMLLATILSTALLAVSAHAQTQQGGNAPLVRERGAVPGPSTSGAAPPDNPVPSGQRTAPPNTPRTFGETNSGRRDNPDRVPPLAPGGQGLAPEAR